MAPEPADQLVNYILHVREIAITWVDPSDFDREALMAVCHAAEKAQPEALARHRCVKCDHRWEGGPAISELCGDCHRAVQAAAQREARASQDRTTLDAVEREFAELQAFLKHIEWDTSSTEDECHDKLMALGSAISAAQPKAVE